MVKGGIVRSVVFKGGGTQSEELHTNIGKTTPNNNKKKKTPPPPMWVNGGSGRAGRTENKGGAREIKFGMSLWPRLQEMSSETGGLGKKKAAGKTCSLPGGV